MVARVLQGMGESAEAVVFAMLRDLDESVSLAFGELQVSGWCQASEWSCWSCLATVRYGKHRAPGPLLVVLLRLLRTSPVWKDDLILERKGGCLV